MRVRIAMQEVRIKIEVSKASLSSFDFVPTNLLLENSHCRLRQAVKDYTFCTIKQREFLRCSRPSRSRLRLPSAERVRRRRLRLRGLRRRRSQWNEALRSVTKRNSKLLTFTLHRPFIDAYAPTAYETFQSSVRNWNN